jgi:hypothetical protein
MPRRSMPLQVGNFYHIYNRGNNRQLILFEHENYIYGFVPSTFAAATALLDIAIASMNVVTTCNIL